MIYTQQLFKIGFMNYRILCWVLPFIMVFSASSVFSAGSDSDDSFSSADSLDVNYLNGKEQVANQDYLAAIRYLLKAVETDPENADVFNLLGYSHRNLEMNDKAFVIMKRHCLSTHVIKEPMNTLGNFT